MNKLFLFTCSFYRSNPTLTSYLQDVMISAKFAIIQFFVQISIVNFGNQNKIKMYKKGFISNLFLNCLNIMLKSFLYNGCYM